ncbi:hypothetical protein BGW36DRAFT_293631 [Talaromyces proteolyticus]|uniref:Zn(2)-C6 fungal-type domain-containing protein n=1 Tax=Talaromyces proteolyticus TaxID=1131652 RepID=A0AAD4KTA0_9EURO|nr:uncharacterized protein BGW36DRAFT_293631 [Talaromyces proteolyticus]KAH8698395.1 hypothetical protein BGW36DRAFT_293631 [Talaromyces proteolyticus]
MPNVGRPSRDCQPCRHRRIRCDLARPGCTQCLRRGLRCHGYRDEISGRFQIETTHSIQLKIKIDGRKKRHLVNTASEKDRCHYKQESTQSLILSPSRESQLKKQLLLWKNHQLAHAVSKPLPVIWTDHALPLACDKFAFSCPVFSTVHRLLSRAEEGSATYLAAYAVGCAYLASMDHSNTALSRHIKAYAKAVSAMNLALRDAEQVRSDSTLLGVWLLGLYELVVATPEKAHKTYSWDIHNQGLLQLIRVRGLEQFQDQDGRNLFCIIFNNLVSKSIILAPDKQYFVEAITWFEAIYQHCATWEYPLLKVYRFSYKCMRLCSSIRDLLAQKHDHNMPFSAMQSILQEVDELESTDDLQFSSALATDWPINLPSEPYDFLNLGYMASYILQSNYRLRVTYHLKDLLDSALYTSDYTSEMTDRLQESRDRCLKEVYFLKEKIQSFLPLIRDTRFRSITKFGADVFLHQPLLH